MSDLSSAGDRIVIFCSFAVATAFGVAGLIGYDFLGDRNVAINEQLAWVDAPVWSEVFISAAALTYGVYAVVKLRQKAN